MLLEYNIFNNWLIYFIKFFNKFTTFSFFIYIILLITKLAIFKKKYKRLQKQKIINHKIAENKQKYKQILDYKNKKAKCYTLNYQLIISIYLPYISNFNSEFII